jgi:hypothetical protein
MKNLFGKTRNATLAVQRTRRRNTFGFLLSIERKNRRGRKLAMGIENHRKQFRLATAAMAACVIPAACVMLIACTPQRPARLDANMLLEIEQLRTRNKELHKQLLQRDEQILALQNLGDKRLDRLYTVRRISLASGTGGASTDDKPGDDAVKVNVAPIDQYGSVLKAAGSVKVQVFDLAMPQAGNLLAECDYDPNAAAKNWSSGLFSSYYSFTLPLPAEPLAHSELTVRVEFTEYLTGKTFTAQQVIKVALPPKPETQPTSKPAAGPSTLPSTATTRALFLQAGQQWAILADANASAAQWLKAVGTLGAIRRFVENHEISPAPSADQGWCGTNAVMREGEREDLRSILLVVTDPRLTDSYNEPKLSQAMRHDLQPLLSKIMPA